MDCEQLLQYKYIFGFLDGTLMEKEQDEINAHLHTCIACAERFVAEKEIEQIFREKLARTMLLPAGLKDKILQKTKETALLKITYPNGREELFPLIGEITTFGRDYTNDIVLSDNKVSHKHCQIERKGNEYELVDLDSTNGVRVNEEKISRHILAHGNKIRIGGALIIFELPAKAEAASVAADAIPMRTPEEKAVSHGQAPTEPVTAVIKPRKRFFGFRRIRNARRRPLSGRLKDKILQKTKEAVILKITYPDGREESFPLLREVTTFGCDDTNDIVLPDNKVSHKHCQIEHKGDEYELVDLESTNGVRVNEEKINRHILVPGDKIRIGGTLIIFELPAKVEAASVAADAIPVRTPCTRTVQGTPEKKSVSPAPPTVVATAKKRSSRLKTFRHSSVPYLTAAAVLLAVIITLILSGVFQSDTEKKYTAAPGAKLQAEVDELLATMDSLSRDYRYDEGVNKGKDFLSRNGDRLTEAQKRDLTTKIQNLEPYGLKEKEAREAFEQVEKEAGGTADLRMVKNKYEELYANSLNTSITARVQAKVAALDSLIQKQNEREQAFNAVKEEIAGSLSSGDYARAAQVCESFRDESDSAYLQSLIAQELTDINTQEQAGFNAVMQQVRDLINRQEMEKARELCQANKSRFHTMTYVAQLDTQIESINQSLAQEGTQKSAVRTTVLKLLVESDASSRKYDYTKAIQKSTEALNAAQSYPELKSVVARRLNDLKKEDELFGKLVEGIKGKTISIRRLNLMHTVVNANRETFSLSSGIINNWSALTTTEIYSLYTLLSLNVSETEAVAVFCLENKVLDGAYQALNRLVQKDPGGKAQLDNLLRFYTGKSIPPGGFIVYKDKWLTPEEKSFLVIQETAQDLANKINTANTPAEVSKSGETFAQLIQTNPDYSAKLKEIIIKAVEQRFNDLNKTLKQKLSSVGLGQLTQLKQELNKKRAEALKEVREGKPVTRKEDGHLMLSPEMDQKIKEVRALWDKPATRAVQLDKSVAQTAELMKALTTELRKYTTEIQDTEYDVDVVISIAIGSKIDLKNYPLNGGEAKLIEYNQKVMKENDANTVANPVEKKTVELQNEYRMMMGLKALKIDDRLTRAARKHSEFMQSTGRFAHDGIGDGTPGSRCKEQGYTDGVGENIYMSTGGANPAAAFDGWYWSHGHHVNMLGPWTAIGCGFSQNDATTDFGVK